MSDLSSTPDADEAILLQCQQEYEAAGDRDAVLGQHCERYPHLEKRLRARAGMAQRLAASAPHHEGSIPDRLGEFRIVSRIGQGGMGEVYLAKHDRLGREVAVKVIRQGHISAEARDRFEREQAVLAKLHQTHIVPIYAAGEEGTLQYFVMPYIKGVALHHVIPVAHQEATLHGDQTPTVVALATRIAESSLAKPVAAEGEAVPQAFLSTRPPTSSFAQLPPVEPEQLEPARDARLTLSPGYFRSVAEVMLAVAEAVQHAHAAGIVHRDIKPSNIMVGTQGQCWIIDFGLAGHLSERASSEGQSDLARREVKPVTVSGVMGTMHYMAPEQLQGRADRRSDVWGVGVTLYELCTLRRPFEDPSYPEIQRRILTESPRPARTLVANMPADLAAICSKAMEKAPANRYQSAEELAADLRRWLRHEPTTARPAWLLRRVGLWALRNPGWAVALALTVLATALVTASTLYIFSTRSNAAIAQAAEAKRGEQRAHRETLIQKMTQARLQSHQMGWWDDTWELVRQASKISTGDDLRDQAAATLLGLDAKVSKAFEFGSSSVAFDPTGRYLLLGGTNQEEGRRWDSKDDDVRLSGLAGKGPVAFAPDGTALQFVARPSGSLLLWHMTGKRPIQELTFPELGKLRGARATLGPLAMTPTPQGVLLAASALLPDNKGIVAVWDGMTGKLLAKLPVRATALALAPDGRQLAIGNGTGQISLRSLVEEKEIARLQADDGAITCLAFGRDLRQENTPGPQWQLAVGDSGGVITVWDLARKVPRSYCRGGLYQVYDVAFSPDGMTLASCHHDALARLWDVTSGAKLLQIGADQGRIRAIAFAPDGLRLALADMRTDRSPERSKVLNLESGHGMISLRGLPGSASRLTNSPDGRLLAVLSSTWRVGIWDVADQRLLHILSVDPGFYVDNAALAFSRDGKLFAFSSGERATLWEVSTGKKKDGWELPPGLGDHLGFHPSGQLLLFRFETASSRIGPFQDNDPRKDPRVCRVRNLFGPTPLKPIRDDFKELNRHVYATAGSLDGSYFAADGIRDRGGKQQRFVCAFNGLTGEHLWSEPVPHNFPGSGLLIDPTGSYLSFDLSDDPVRTKMIELPSGKEQFILRSAVHCMSPGAKYFLRGNLLCMRETEATLVSLGIGEGAPKYRQFSLVGQRLAWVTEHGDVVLCDLREVQRRLAGVGLGW